MNKTANEGIERKVLIFNIQKYSLYDGPGTRTIVFFKGCPLRCKWCSNPEGLSRKYDVMYKKNYCVDCGACVSVCPQKIHEIKDGVHIVRRDIDCIGCRKCVAVCPKSALEISGEFKTISELMDIIKEDESFYDISGGGVTLGGGECTLQGEAAKNLLRACKEYGIHTAIETCGYTNPAKMLELAEYVDLFLFDLKHMDPKKHNDLTGMSNEIILHNLEELIKRRKQVIVRMPMLKGINDSEEEILKISDFLQKFISYKNFQGIHLLPYHKLGVNKYQQLDMEYQIEGDPSLSEEDLNRIEQLIAQKKLHVRVIRH
ncbi:choline TMA-lyase-activating enzyme [Clostridiales bacterium COT073_COT-073]|nr:choline TMA-lyase-activating enzyme [Clostridiales bacterium COT073_COT-073]